MANSWSTVYLSLVWMCCLLEVEASCPALGCPAGWWGFGNSCYSFRAPPTFPSLNWKYAQGECLKYGGDLVSVTNETEMYFINSKSSTHEHYWIGLNDQSSEGDLVWSDGTTYNRSKYHSWYPNEPSNNNNDEDCVKLVNKTWTAENCSKVYSYICERPKAYYFNVWLILAKKNLTLDLLNTSSEQHETMKANVMNKLNWIFNGSHGSVLAEFQRFGAQTKRTTEPFSVRPMADIIVFYTNSSVKLEVFNKIKASIKSMQMFDINYLKMVDIGNCTCPPAIISLNLPKNIEETKVTFKKINLTAHITHSLCSTSARGTWHITRAPLKRRTFRYFMKKAVKQNIPVWPMWPGAPSDTYFYVSYLLTIPPENKIIGYDYGYVLLRQSILVANITGISTATKGDGNITLNGSLSYDTGALALSFKWFCRRNSEKFPTDHSLPVVDVSKGRSNASGGCYGYGPGRLSSTKSSLVVAVDKMKLGRTYCFKLVVSNGLKTAQAFHKLRIQAFFEICCIENCPPKVIPSKIMIMESSCTGVDCRNIAYYQLLLFKRNPKDSWHSWTEVTKLENRTLSGLNDSRLTLPGKLEMNTYYKINASITVRRGDKIASNEITFKTTAPVSVPRQRCKVSPDEGVVLETNFIVNCSRWHAESGNFTYTFSFISQAGSVTLESSTRNFVISTNLPQGKKSDDYNVTVKVKISDKDGVTHVDTLVVKVKPSTKMINATEKAIEIENFLKKGNVAKAAAVAIVSLSSTDDDGKDVILHSMAHVQVSRISDAALLSIVNLLATDDRASIPLATLEDALKLLNKTTIFLQKYAKNHSDILVNEIGERTLRGLSNTMAASTDIAQNLGKDLTGRILSMVDELGSALLSIKTTGQRQSVYKSNTIIIRLGRHNTSEVGGMELGRTENEGRVVFPSIKVLFEIQEARMPFVDTQMVTFKDNPYVWTSNSKYIKSSVVSLDLKKLDGSRLNISGLTHPFELFIPGKESNDSIHKEKEAHFFVKPYNDVSHIQYHKIVLETRFDSAYVEIRPANKAFFDIFVSAGVKPKPDNYTFRTRIPDFSSCRNHPSGIGYLNCEKSPYTFSLSKNVTGSIGEHFIGIRLANETNKESKRNRLKRSCMGRRGRWKRSCVGVKDPPTTPTPSPKLVKPKYDNRTDVNYTMSVRIKNCLYWSDIKQDWTNEGCRVGQKEEKGYLQCLCTHLSAFGGRIFVAPNPIDFKKVWETLKRPTAESFVVLATVCVIFGIYFVGLVLARRADRKDKSKVAANVYLTDLNKEGYTYNISIQTGMWTGCGTTANVGIIINGEQGSSSAIPLTDPLAPRKCFTRGSVNKFTLILPFSLGNLTDINIWHDNNGSDPSWFLQYVFITDQLTEKVWYFFANKWLALDKRSGTIELYIEVAKEDRLTLFKPLFYARTARDLGEGHIWISVFTRPPQSPFTRCQRLSCCLSFLFTAMATSAMFYQFGRTPTDTFKFGPLEMSWTQIMIGIQSSVIAIPANLLVVVLFKNRKQKRPKEIYDPGERQRKSKPTGFLPPYFVYVAWCLCMLISLAGAAVTVMYSLAWGPDKSNQWLTSILVSLVQDVIVTQPIKVFLIAALLSLLIKKPPQQETGLGPSFFQSETAKNVMSRRPKEDELAEARDTNGKEWDMHETAKEVLSFLILSIILIVICYGNQHPARYQFTYSTSGVFRGFDEVKDTISLWKWVNNILLPGLYDVQWYNGNPFVQKEGFISNKKTFMMGMPRLRQIRIKTSNVCPADVMKIPVNYTFPRCFQEYSSANEDRTPFHLPRWISLENYSQLQSLNEICPKPWRYQSASQTDTLSHEAVTETFEGGGYIAELGYDNESASTVARDLRANNWVDERTAAVFIEFTLFDPSTLLFCNVRNVFERLPTGHAVTSVDVRALPLYPSSSGNFQLFYEVCQLLFLVVIVLFFVAEMTKFFRQKRYLHQLWNWLELLLLVVSFASVALSFQKGKYTSLYVKKVKSNPYDTFSCDRIMVLLDLETVMLSAAIFIITLRLLRLIRFNRHVCQMRETLRSSASSILSFSLVFAVGIVAFTQLGYLCFGANLVNFSSFSKSLRMVLEMTLGHSIDGNEIHEKYPVLGPLYLFWLLIGVVFTLINVFVAILVGAYEKTREGQVDASFADADLGNFMYNVFLRKIKVLRNKVPLSKTSLGKSTSDQSGTIRPRLVNYSRLSSCFTKFRKYKSMNDIKPEALQPAESVTIRQEALHSLVVEDCFDQEEGGILDDLKTSLVEMLSELELLLNGNSNKQVRFSCGELNKFGDKHQTSL